MTPRRIKTFINYAELQWAVLLNAGRTVDRGNFNLWLVFTEAGGERFRKWLGDLPKAERPQHIKSSMSYVQRAKEGVEGNDRAGIDPRLKLILDEIPRLRRVLEQLSTFDMTAEELDLYIYLCAPPVEERPVEEPVG